VVQLQLLVIQMAMLLVLPKLVKKDLPFKKSLGVAALASLAVGVAAKTLHVFVSKYEFIGKNIPHFGLTEIFYVTFFLFVVVVMGFLLPQKYLRQSPVSLLQYTVTMVLLLSMLGIVLKMGARLGFNIKYIFSLPGLNLNI
jgi:hypothetical protein